MGFEDESDILALADTPERRCEIAYYVGLKAASEGRLTEAAEWFLVAMETGQVRDFEYQWAQDQLYYWSAEGRSLAVLSARATN